MRPNSCLALVAMAFSASAFLAATDAAVAQGRAPGPFSAFAPDCEIAAVDKEHLFLAAGIRQGDTLTNIQMSPDVVTTAIKVAVKESRKPVTLLLQAEAPGHLGL